jgi:hypothetical protein
MLENLGIALRKQRKLVLIFFLTIFLPAVTLSVFCVRAIRISLTSSTPKFESWRVSPDGGNLQQLELAYSGGGMRLHPDGRQITFFNGRVRRELWVMENFLPKKK